MARTIISKLTSMAIDNMADAVLGINKEEELVLINPGAENIFNIKKDQALNKKIWDIIPEKQLLKLILSVMRDEGAYREEMMVFPGDLIFLVQAFPLKEDERVIGTLAFLKDLTEVYRLEKAVNQFVGNVSHELKSPLTSIKGFVETLLEGELQNPEVCRKFLQIINNETNRMTRLIIDLLQAASLPDQEQHLNLKPVKLKPLIENILVMWRPVAEQRHIRIVVEIPEDLPAVLADEDRLRQVFINLLDNAVKYTSLKKEGQVVFNAYCDKNTAIVTVEDSGIGIADEERDKIFQRFHRVTAGPGAELGGTGLGLSIVKQIVEAHNGNIKVESTYGQGTKFIISLPLKGEKN